MDTSRAMLGSPSQAAPLPGAPECAGLDFRGIHQRWDFGTLSTQVIPANPHLSPAIYRDGHQKAIH